MERQIIQKTINVNLLESMKQTFYSNGKLLITAEYVVLDGGLALALPTNFGQSLIVEKVENNKKIHWKSYDSDGSLWFETNIFFENIIKNEQTENNEIQKTLIEILHQAYSLNPSFLSKSNGYEIETKLSFPRNWGLGTSSTLINNIAQWTVVDAFDLLEKSFGGSGYDIACAQNNCPILYQIKDEKPIIKPINFYPKFTENIYFVYLNQKQNSRKAILNYRNKINDFDDIIPKINQITEIVLTTTDLKQFATALENHEILMSAILEMQTIKESLFIDFDGVIKSLGAWGGDFVMAVSKENPTEYFKNKGFETILSYTEMILSDF
jgi:mevalonate kinase